jgi:predicted kinase
MARLYRPDRPAIGIMEWYVERKERCIEQILDVAFRILEASSDVILELGLIQRESRQVLYKRFEGSSHKMVIYVLDAPREERRMRVKNRNVEKGETFSMEVPDEMFEMASSMWEEPGELECSEQEVIFVPQATAMQPTNG